MIVLTTNSDPLAVSCVLGYSNPDTGPYHLRLYGLDKGPQPRWDRPHARVAEMPLWESGSAHEGDRVVVVRVGSRFVSDEVLEQARLAAAAAVSLVLFAEGVSDG